MHGICIKFRAFAWTARAQTARTHTIRTWRKGRCARSPIESASPMVTAVLPHRPRFPSCLCLGLVFPLCHDSLPLVVPNFDQSNNFAICRSSFSGSGLLFSRNCGHKFADTSLRDHNHKQHMNQVHTEYSYKMDECKTYSWCRVKWLFFAIFCNRV